MPQAVSQYNPECLRFLTEAPLSACYRKPCTSEGVYSKATQPPSFAKSFLLDNTSEIWRMVTVNGKWARGLISQKLLQGVRVSHPFHGENQSCVFTTASSLQALSLVWNSVQRFRLQPRTKSNSTENMPIVQILLYLMLPLLCLTLLLLPGQLQLCDPSCEFCHFSSLQKKGF